MQATQETEIHGLHKRITLTKVILEYYPESSKHVIHIMIRECIMIENAISS